MNTLFSSEVAVLAIMAVTVALAFFIQRYKWASWAGPALFSVILGILLSNLKILPFWHDVYGVFFEYAIPLSLTMMLLNVDLKKWLKLAKQPLLAMLFAVLSVSIVSIIAGLYFAPKIPEGWKLAGMFIGTYTGGSSNLTAIATGLNATPTTLAGANAADYVVGIPAMIILFAIPAFIVKWKGFKKFWPYSLTEEELNSGEQVELFAKQKWSVQDIALLFAIAFAVTAISTMLASQFSELVASAVRIISVTTLAIILAQFKPVREIKGNTDLGIFIAMFFLVIIGLTIDIKAFVSTAPMITLYCSVIIITSFILHLVLCRVFKIKYQYVLISIIASIADGTSAAVVSGSAKWKSIVSTAVILGSLGMALGNYVGIGVAYLIKGLIGA
jgi:uncharacterized membrane protein